MTRIRHIHGVAAQHGLSLAEFYALDVAAVFATDPKTAVRFIRKILEGSPYADANCRAAVKRCIERGWLALSSRGMLTLTPEGTAMMHKIADGL